MSIYKHVYVHMNECMYVWYDIRTPICTYVRPYVCTYARSVCMCARYGCTYARYVCVCMHARYVCTYICTIYMYVCTICPSAVCMYVRAYLCMYVVFCPTKERIQSQICLNSTNSNTIFLHLFKHILCNDVLFAKPFAPTIT